MIYYFFICFYYAYSQIIAVTLDRESHRQKYIQTSNNNTYAFYVNKLSPYYLIEIEIVSQMIGEVAFLYQEGSAPTKDQNGDLTYDWMDYNGYMLKKLHQYIVIYTDETSQGLKQFITVLSTQNINYVLSIKGSTDEPCPFNCNSNGKCQYGYCYCNDGWIDEDCSQIATQVGIGQAVAISNPSLRKNYAYYQHNGSGKQLELTISTNTYDNISVEILVPNLVYLPTDRYNDASAIINSNNPYHAIILQANTNNNDDEGYVPEDLIIAFQKQQQTDIFGDVTIQIVESKLKDNNTITIIASVLSIVFALTLLFIIYMCFCRNKTNNKTRQDPKEDKEFILMDQLQVQVMPPLDPTKFNEQECTICLDPLNNGKEIRRTPCDHIFHTKCIQQWVQSKHSHCPNCREDLKIEQLQKPSGGTRKILIQPNTIHITS